MKWHLLYGAKNVGAQAKGWLGREDCVFEHPKYISGHILLLCGFECVICAASDFYEDGRSQAEGKRTISAYVETSVCKSILGLVFSGDRHSSLPSPQGEATLWHLGVLTDCRAQHNSAGPATFPWIVRYFMATKP